jgi:hypothetical protein
MSTFPGYEDRMYVKKDLLRYRILDLSELTNAEIRELVEIYLKEIPGDDSCRNIMCTQIGGRCVGYHCAKCGKPTSMMGCNECFPMKADQ